MIRRGLVIYEPRGRAGEYAPLACNLYRGCGHGCIYCYGPEFTYIDREDFIMPSPRPEVIKRLERDAPIAAETYDGLDRRVLLCFTCDPYQPIDEIYQLSAQAIKILHSNGFTVNILTKAGKRAEGAFELLRPGDQFATTLTFLNDERSRLWEPLAALPMDRIDTLRKAHDLGIETWVSLEPVIDPAVSMDIIKQTHTFIDRYKVGKLNYAHKLPEPFRSQVRGINWHKFAIDVVSLLKELGCQYYIKKDLRAYL